MLRDKTKNNCVADYPMLYIPQYIWNQDGGWFNIVSTKSWPSYFKYGMIWVLWEKSMRKSMRLKHIKAYEVKIITMWVLVLQLLVFNLP